MRVAVIGAGIAGVTTAYELARQGDEVTVYERGSSVAGEASFAGGGIVAAGHVAPRVLPDLGDMGGLRALAHVPWLWRWWRAGRPAVLAANRRALQQLAHDSRERMLELTRAQGLEYEQEPGLLVLLRDERDLKAAHATLALLAEWGVPHELVDAARCRALEPGLAESAPVHAAIHLAQDGVGNCRLFAQQLKTQAQRLGADFRLDAAVRGITPGAHPGVVDDDGQAHEFDAVVVCAGAQAAPLLTPLGLRLPLLPVHGYSVTAPLRHLDGLPRPGPRAALIDERMGVTIARLGQRVRASGGAVLGGSAAKVEVEPLRRLYRLLEEWFDGAAVTREAQHWKGAQPTLPDGPPVLGASGAPGVWLNVGHGASGWTLACGSARVLAEVVAGRAAPIDLERFSVARLK
ncbi:MAG: FAD-dependent oxidoreductase [Burkholderiales bacterium]|nr:FAD-dependent oxidoreductase [Burkholderiales bacterium]